MVRRAAIVLAACAVVGFASLRADSGRPRGGGPPVVPWPDFVAWTPSDWSASSEALTALVALGAIAFAGRQVHEAKKTREEQAQPFVVVDFEPSSVWSNIINLVVTNVGKTLARDVRLTFEPKLASTHVKDEWDLNETVLIKEGIPAMPPGKRLVALFDIAARPLQVRPTDEVRRDCRVQGLTRSQPGKSQVRSRLERVVRASGRDRVRSPRRR